MGDSEDRDRYRTNLQGEVDGAALYRVMAQVEPDPRLAEVYRRLGAIEEAHAEFWRGQLGKIGASATGFRPDFRARALAWLARRFGAGFVLPIINSIERQGRTDYDNQPEAVAQGLPGDERSHARVLDAMNSAGLGAMTGSVLGRIEGRHRSMGGNALRRGARRQRRPGL